MHDVNQKSLKLNEIEGRKILIFSGKQKSRINDVPNFQMIVGSFGSFLAPNIFKTWALLGHKIFDLRSQLF